jgi:mannose-6-phosphate isomerase-like protein (cupin superfamily)
VGFEMTQGEAVVMNLADAPRRPMRFDRGTQIALIGEDTGARRVDVHINVLNVDSGPGPYHFHEHAENVYIVLEGELQVNVEGTQYVLRRDDVAFIPPGLKHSAGNAGTSPARVIEIYAPVGADFHFVEGDGNART